MSESGALQRSKSGAEEALSFECEGERLVGVLHRPDAPSDLGVVMLVGGPQVRCGAHRLFVRIARALAGAGHAVLRFDVRGMGDSSGAPCGFERISPDIGVAADALQCSVPEVRRLVLWGLCDGASAALLYLDDTHDPRVTGLALLNPWVRSEATLARTRINHYYRERLLRADFWKRLLSGQVGRKAVNDLLDNVRRASSASGSPPRSSFHDRMARCWGTFRGPIMLALSVGDATADEFHDVLTRDPKWMRPSDAMNLVLEHILDDGHTLPRISAQRLYVDRLLEWFLQDHCR